MTFFALDSETAKFGPGLYAPPLTVVSWADEKLNAGLVNYHDALPFLKKKLESDETLVLFNGAYDMAVFAAEHPELLPRIFEKYASERGVCDVRLNQRLIDIMRGELGGRKWTGQDGKQRTVQYRYDLDAVHARWGCGNLDKDPEIRLSFGDYRDVPIEQWTERRRAYALEDAVATMRVNLLQWAEFGDYLDDTFPQARAAFALHLMTCRGIRTDAEACARLREECEIEIERCRELCEKTAIEIEVKKGSGKRQRIVTEQHALIERQRDGGYKKNTKAAKAYMLKVCAELEIQPKLTEKDGISLDAEATGDTGDPVLMAYSTYTSAATLRSKVRRMAFGAIGPLQTQYETLVNTGRTSSSKPPSPLVGDNYQNQRRGAMVTELKHELPGQRECFIPRPGYVFCSVDLDNAEMRAMAQMCIWKVGYSKLAEVLNDRKLGPSGGDTHLSLGASIMGLDYAEAERRYKAGDKEVKQARQFAKIPNFALLGGAGALAMQPYAKRQKPSIILSKERCFELYDAFHNHWTEVSEYQAEFKAACAGGLIDFRHFVSGRIRGLCWYTAAVNAGFQGLTGDASKAALLPIQYECYVDKRSPLFGSYLLLYVHDEVIAELPEDRYHEAGFRLAELMVKPWNDHYTPDVPMTAKPAFMRRWYKDAGLVLDANGRAMCWEPEKKKAA